MPAELQNAVAQLLDNGKDKQVWLKRSLGTKAVQEANVRAKPVQMQFDRLIAQARASLAARPMRSSLSAAEIQRMTEYTYAQMLAGQDKFVREAPAIEAEYRAFEDQPQQWIDAVPVFGLSAGQMLDAHVSMPELISEAETALARGDIGYYAARAKIEDALEVFQIALDAKCDDYRRLGVEVLRAYVRGLRDVAARYNGEPIPTPQLVLPARMAESGGTLWDALEGWRKEKSPSKGVFDEYERGVRLFTELHGNIAVAQINRTHARVFREALQELPKHRRADLRTAPILQLTEWSRKNPDAKRIANTTASKLLGGVQTVARWAFKNGIVPDDVRWSDPFAEMRLEREVPEREAFTTSELNILFRSPVFTEYVRPKPGRGEAAFWLPMLALYTGARRGELAALRAGDISEVDGVEAFIIREERTSGKKLKTRASARTIPVHPQLTALGWSDFVKHIRHEDGEKAWLFPEVSPAADGGLKAWTKWFHRHLRTVGVADTAKVFHSFRHTFKDALRAARTPEDLHDALTGHSNTSVGRTYGAKVIVQRYGIQTLKDAVDHVHYRGLDLSKVRSRKTRLKDHSEAARIQSGGAA